MLITLISLVIEPGAELAAPQTGCQDGPVFGAGGTDGDLWATVSSLRAEMLKASWRLPASLGTTPATWPTFSPPRPLPTMPLSFSLSEWL